MISKYSLNLSVRSEGMSHRRPLALRDYLNSEPGALSARASVRPDGLTAQAAYDLAMVCGPRGDRVEVRGPAPERAEALAVAPIRPLPASSAEPVVAILHDPSDRFAPSSEAALAAMRQKFLRRDLRTTMVDMRAAEAPVEADALFVRTCTAPRGGAWLWANAAAQAGLPTIDDPDSILKCCNKLFLAETFRRAGVAAPACRYVCDDESLREAFETLGAPLVLKTPEGSFSRGVAKAETIEDARTIRSLWADAAPILLAQAYTPTSFDWRIGVLDGAPLYACRYFMVHNHWQIVKFAQDGAMQEGRGVAVRLEDAPADVLAAATRAADSVGRGLYGVDIKVVDAEPLVIEVNDNPTIEADLEASRDAVWERIAGYFLRRIDRARAAA